MRLSLPHSALLLALLTGPTTAAVAEKAKLVTFARTYGDYTSGAAETFALAEGQFEGGQVAGDDLHELSFNELSYVLAAALADRGYEPAAPDATPDLIIVVHRGRTQPSGAMDGSVEDANPRTLNPSAMATPSSDPMVMRSGATVPTYDKTSGPLADERVQTISRKLGYTAELRSLANARNHPMASRKLDDVIMELTQDRYYVVLGAYDGAALRNQGRQVLLWETRFSFLAEEKSFLDRFPAMTEAASHWFGRTTEADLDRRFVSID